MKMTPKKARSILASGIEHEVYEGSIPDDDDKAVSEAKELVEMATEAREAGNESEAIDAVLFKAEVDGGTASDPDAKDEGEEPWDGYAEEKVSTILPKLHDLDDDDLAKVFDFETANKARGSVLNTLEHIAEDRGSVTQTGGEPDPAPEPDEPDPAPEPWRGYAKKKVAEILKVLPNKDDETLTATWQYESENKERAGIMKALKKLAEERGLSSDPDPETDEPQADPDADEMEATEAGEIAGEAIREQQAGDEYSPEHSDLIADVMQRIESENLSVPKRLPEERVELPFDFSEVSDAKLRSLHSAFTSYFARTKYLVMLESQCEKACKQIADRKLGEVMATLPKVNPDTKKEIGPTLLKAEAEADEKVAEWRERQFTHSRLAESHRDELEIYSQNITSLSREWTMRHEEMEHTGKLNRGRK